MKAVACREVRRRLDEGRPRKPEVRAHLVSCPSCRAHGALLDTLASVPPLAADEATVGRIMARLPAAPWRRRRRPAAWLPLAAALALVVAGLLLVGIPAPGAAAALPGVAGGCVAWVALLLPVASAALRGGSDAAQAMLAAEGLWLVVWLALTAAGGGWGVQALLRRRRREERA